MSRYRATMSELLKKVNEAYEKDHEVSMARTDLQSIADKALIIDKHLKEHHTEETGIEGWIASKITKASDYINAVHDHMIYSPEMNEETISEKSFTSQQIKQAYGILNDPRYKGGNYDGAVAAIEKLAKGLSKHPDVANALRRANEEVDLDESLDESRMKDIFTANQEGESAEEIAKRLKLSVKTVKSILGESKQKPYVSSVDGVYSVLDGDGKEVFKTKDQTLAHAWFKKNYDKIKEEVLDEKVADSIIKDLQKAYTPLKGKTISPEMANKISKHLDGQSFDVVTLRQLMKADIPFISTLARNKIYKKTGKFESVEEQQQVPVQKEPQDNQQALNAKDKEIESLKGQVNLLRQKVENEKNRAVKPEPNPETGEVPLTIGIAHKLLKDKEQKEKETKKESVNYPEGARLTYESIQAVKNKAEKTGMPYSILKQVYDRGMAAWRGGHRPGATQQQWALARVNSFVTKSSGTWGGADSDLAKKVKGEK